MTTNTLAPPTERRSITMQRKLGERDSFANLAGRVQHRSRTCSGHDDAEAFVASLPQVARDFGIIVTATSEDGTVTVHASWTSGVRDERPSDPSPYASHPAWDAIEAAAFPDGQRAWEARR